MKKFILFLLLFVFGKVQAVEYVCWQQAELQGMAFESSIVNCPDGVQKEKGTAAEQAGMPKSIVCMIPAVCLALTPKVVEHLRKNTGLSYLEDIKKLDSKLIQTVLADTNYIGRPSTVVCEGKGTAKNDPFGKLSIDNASCPNFTACANAEELFYNMSLQLPANVTSSTHIHGTSPMKTTPTQKGKK